MAVTKCLVIFLNFFLLIEAQSLMLCGKDQYGITSAYEIALDKGTLVAGYSTYKVVIPEICNGYTTMGVQLTACDYDVTPQIMVVSRNLAYVKRKGSLDTNGYIIGSVYCYDSSPYAGSNPSGKNEPLSIHPVNEARQTIRKNQRVVRSPEKIGDASKQDGTYNMQSSNFRQTGKQGHNNNARDENENLSDSRKQSSKTIQSQQTNEEIRKALDDHVRQVTIDQAQQKAQQNKQTSNTKQQNSEKLFSRYDSQAPELNQKTSIHVSQNEKLQQTNKQKDITENDSEHKLFRRNQQNSESENEANLNDEFLKDIASRLGSNIKNSRLTSVRQTEDAIREIVAANAHLSHTAALARASLQSLEEAQRAAQMVEKHQKNNHIQQILDENSRHLALTQASLEANRESELQIAKAIHPAAETVFRAAEPLNYYSQRHRMVDNLNADLKHMPHQSLAENQRKIDNAAKLDASHASELVRQIIEENAREATRYQQRLQSINEQIRSAHSSQQMDVYQSNDARLASLNLARQQTKLESPINYAHHQSGMKSARHSPQQTSYSTDPSYDANTELVRTKARLTDQTSDAQRAENLKRSRRSPQNRNDKYQAIALKNDYTEYTREPESTHQREQARLQAVRQNQYYSREKNDVGYDSARLNPEILQLSNNERNSLTASSPRYLDQSYRQEFNNLLQNSLDQNQRVFNNLQQNDGFRQHDNRRTSSVNNRQESETAELKLIPGASKSDQSSFHLVEDFNRQFFGSNGKSRLEAIQQASRLAQDANARQLAEVLRESLESKRLRQNSFEQARRQAQQILNDVQRIGDEQSNDALREALSQAARQNALNEAEIEALHAASRTGKYSQLIPRQNVYEHNNEERQHAQNRNMGQETQSNREAIVGNARQTGTTVARLQALREQDSFVQGIDSRERLSANARHSATDQIPLESLNQSRQSAQLIDTRQEADEVDEAYSRQNYLDRVHQYSLKDFQDQMNSRRQAIKNQLQATIDSRFSLESF